MRVVLMANTGWYLRNFRSRLVIQLEKSGHEVILVAPEGQDTDDQFFRDREFVPLKLTRRGKNPIIEIISIARLAVTFLQMKPDVVLTWTPKPTIYGGLVGRLCNVAVIPNVSGLGDVFTRDTLFTSFVRMLYRAAFRRSPVVLFQNNEDRIEFINHDVVVEERSERLPGSGVDLDHFSVCDLPANKPFVFLFVGRLIRDKGLYELVEAISVLHANGHNAILRIVGFIDEGNPKAVSTKDIEFWDKKTYVEYIGGTGDIRPVVASVHCVVLPSYYREGVPRSLLEAAAMGRPIITTNMPGCRDAVMAGRSGFLCSPRSVQSLASAMERMVDLSDSELCKMGLSARLHVENEFSEGVVLERYSFWLKKIESDVNSF